MDQLEGIRIANPNSSRSSGGSLAIHRASHTISKPKPKIRIIHIFAPEIIKTDVANFRELVQRLTGKPTEKKSTNNKPLQIPAIRRSSSSSDQDHQLTMVSRTTTTTTTNTLTSSSFHHQNQRVKKEEVEIEDEDEENEDNEESGHVEEQIWNGFSDFEGFIKELGEFPLLPLDTSHHQIMHGFEETQFA